MSNRGVVAVLMVLVGVGLMFVSYFYWAAPWGFPPSAESYSNPRVPLAPLFFIVGVMVSFLSAVVYELMPDKKAPRKA